MQQNAHEAEFYEREGYDPHIDWALGPGRAFFLVPLDGREWLPVLLELSDDIEPRSFAEIWATDVRIPDVYTTNRPEGFENSRYCSALVSTAFVGLLRSNARLQRQIVQMALGPPLSAETALQAGPRMARGRDRI